MIPKISHAALVASLSVVGCGGSTVMHLGDTDQGGSSGGADGEQSVGASGQGFAGGMSTDTGGTDVTVATDAGMAMCTPNAGQSVPLSLTNFEYVNTVRDLLGDASAASAAAADFPSDPLEVGFRREVGPADTHRQLHYLNAAVGLAQSAVGHISDLLPCSPASGEAMCATQFIATFGRRAFRRPLTTAEASDMQQAYAQGRMGADFASGIKSVILAMLASPSFYEIEPKAAAPGLAPLGPYQQASRLSYFIYRSMPDAQLLDAAEGGKLATADGVVSQAKRMLADPKAHDGIISFFSEWLTLDRLDSTMKDPAVLPNFDALKADMATETTKFAESVFFGDGLFQSLFESSHTWVNEALANLYGQAGVVGAFQQVQLNPKVRAGVLTQASFLSIYAGETESSPTLRGIFVRDKLLCQQVPPPPPNLSTLPDKKPGQTNRQRYESAFVSPACTACHRLIEPIGYGFEQFDAVGRFRVTDSGLTVDASGQLVNANEIDGPFNGAVDLSTKLASSSVVQDCAAAQWFRFALSRSEAAEDACSLTAAAQSLKTSGSLPELVVALVTSDSFRYARW